jgi:hypothetical protein
MMLVLAMLRKFLLMPMLSLKADAEEQQQDEHAMEWW